MIRLLAVRRERESLNRVIRRICGIGHFPARVHRIIEIENRLITIHPELDAVSPCIDSGSREESPSRRIEHVHCIRGIKPVGEILVAVYRRIRFVGRSQTTVTESEYSRRCKLRKIPPSDISVGVGYPGFPVTRHNYRAVMLPDHCTVRQQNSPNIEPAELVESRERMPQSHIDREKSGFDIGPGDINGDVDHVHGTRRRLHELGHICGELHAP